MSTNTNNIPSIDDIRARIKGLTGSDPEFGPKGLHVAFAGVVLSLQWGVNNYCYNSLGRRLGHHSRTSSCDPCANFEAAAWLDDGFEGDWLRLGAVDDVRGWVAWDDLAALVHDVKVLAHKAGA